MLQRAHDRKERMAGGAMRIQNIGTKLAHGFAQPKPVFEELHRMRLIQVQLPVDFKWRVSRPSGQRRVLLAKQQHVVPGRVEAARGFQRMPGQRIAKTDVSGKNDSQIRTSVS